MKKLSDAHLRHIDSAKVLCETSRDKLQELIEQYNEFLNEWRPKAEAVLAEYNTNLNEMRSVYEEAAEEAQDYYDGRTEKWQDSDRGQAYASWISDLENPELDELELDLTGPIEDVEFPDWDDTESWLPANEPGE